MRLGVNLPGIGTFNERVVINALRRRPGQSITELSFTTGLAIPTVGGIVKQLSARGLVRSVGTQSVGRGRPRQRLALDPGAGFGLGVHLDPTQVTIALLDLAGRTRSTRVESGALEGAPDGAVSRIARLSGQVIDEAGIDPDRIVGAGVASPGPIDPERGRLIDPPWLPGWSGFPLRDAMSRALGRDVVFEKDTLAAVTGELWLRDDDEGTVLFVYLGIGIGMGIAQDGEVLRGASGNAGEVGRFFRGPGTGVDAGDEVPASIDPARLIRLARENGVLPAAGERGGVDQAARIWPSTAPTQSVLADIDESFRTLCDLAGSGDGGALAILHGAGAQIAHVVGLLRDLIDVDSVILGGPYWEKVREVYAPLIVAELSARHAGASIHPTAVSDSVMGAEAGAIGAAALALEEHYIPRRSVFDSPENRI